LRSIEPMTFSLATAAGFPLYHSREVIFIPGVIRHTPGPAEHGAQGRKVELNCWVDLTLRND
jgi:hypothetical protein